MTYKVLFVCLGNICRSPMADAVFQEIVERAGLSEQFEIDSAGTAGYHAGEPAHDGTRQILAEHGIDYHGRSRQVTRADMTDPERWIIPMDDSNLRHLRRTFGDHPRLHKLLDFTGKGPADKNVPDPYYTGSFDTVYQMVEAGCKGLLTEITS